MTNAKQILQDARDGGYAIGAFNAADLVTAKAIVNAAAALQAPVIIEASAGEVGFVGLIQMRALVDAYVTETGMPILLNLDHALDEDVINEAVDIGYDLIHIDGSELDQCDNIKQTKEVAALTHQRGLLCEGELDHIQGSSDDHRREEVSEILQLELYTDSVAAAEFVEETGVDIFAAFFGNVHGVYNQPPQLDFKRLQEIGENVDAMLSMHGGSGIRDEDVKRAIEIGKIAKINVNSELRIAYREALEESLARSSSVKPYEYYAPVVAAVQGVIEDKIELFGSTGKV